jgi:hypothetical protein
MKTIRRRIPPADFLGIHRSEARDYASSLRNSAFAALQLVGYIYEKLIARHFGSFAIVSTRNGHRMLLRLSTTRKREKTPGQIGTIKRPEALHE